MLKPLAGLDRRSWNRTCARSSNRIIRRSRSCSRCAQLDDPAVDVVDNLAAEYPHVASHLLVTGEPPYPNAKVFSLDRMLRARPGTIWW